MSAAERGFRRFTIGDPTLLAALARGAEPPLDVPPLDARTESLLRIGALIALNAPAIAYGEAVSTAMQAGVGFDELFAVLVAVAATVGSARVTSAAPKIALAAGFDVEASLDQLEPGERGSRAP